ncbi:anaerobic ribonucleoside-triphosphate reductase [Heliophilum fasciatum]|uniref:Anaerobic ribonucleoside-triphosphate reductase-like protein n=1 Tax=Heliophilum fasciatum TaxID=35700 RepID=A0A4R2RLE4_9FIRM|nr:anaerobic ribonucleoside-triphosphate reductase [Heliophilum fasciatum]MCW2277753.1 hypothetical protein [Heliophilum fasciatum]TCP64752.1 anaerobic ribonucleoside-triphosphate reductase-like protein [Heliophilum fasciatum]
MKLKTIDGTALTNEQRIMIYDDVRQGIESGDIKVYQAHSVIIWTDEQGLAWQVKGETPIERIRRITGYLSKVDNFNGAKKAELEHRVAHCDC